MTFSQASRERRRRLHINRGRLVESGKMPAPSFAAAICIICSLHCLIHVTTTPYKLHLNCHGHSDLDPFMLRSAQSTTPRAAGSSSSPRMRLPFHQTESKPTLSWRRCIWRIRLCSSVTSYLSGSLRARSAHAKKNRRKSQHRGMSNKKQDVDVWGCGNNKAIRVWPEAIKPQTWRGMSTSTAKARNVEGARCGWCCLWSLDPESSALCIPPPWHPQLVAQCHRKCQSPGDTGRNRTLGKVATSQPKRLEQNTYEEAKMRKQQSSLNPTI